MSFKIGFIGGGNMSTAIAKGILSNDIYSPSKMWVSGPHMSSLTHWEELGVNVTTKNGEVFGNCQIIFLGVKPAMLNDAIADIIRTLPSNVDCKNILFISMLAGITIDQLHKALQLIPNGTDLHVVRIMPNMPMSVGAGTCLYTPDSKTTNDECEMLTKLLSSCGMCELVSENLLNAGGALPGCGPAFMYMVVEALADGAVKQGVPRAMAIRLAAQVLIGSGIMVLRTNKHPGLLKDEVCSPGGSTICGVAALEKAGLRASLIEAIEVASRRTRELGQQ